jgi:hypothetical protein
MAKIYSMAYITILASSAADAADGFLQRRPPDETPSIQIPFRVSLNQFGSATARINGYPLASERRDNPLGRRAWALQEQMMANRLLLYTPSTLEWRCAAGTRKLGQALDIDSEMPKLISQLGGSREEVVEQWCMIIEDYSQRAMAIQSDKLPAIAALAEKFAPVLGEYYAGIWKHSFVRQLMWRRLGQLELGRRNDTYRAPSWSWASLDNGVSFR